MYEVKVPLTSVFEVILHRCISDHITSEIGLTEYRYPTINFHVISVGGNGNKLEWTNEFSSIKRISSEILTPTKPTTVINSKSSRLADFELSEFARVIHVLANPRMIFSR